ncbi:MAG TPA: hypothetical protein VHS58_09850, partial [Acetobacteraceae bacterium]|nr:hypothetical protein [Acetobacteraceae bacterium]
MNELADSSSIACDAAALAARMDADGYLLMRGLVPREAIADVQRAVAGLAHEAGWLRRDREPAEAIADP